jgi:hypothetical protein
MRSLFTYKYLLISVFITFLTLGYVRTSAGYQNNTSDATANPIKIYPQPFRTDINIDLNNSELFKKDVTVDVFDLLGQNKFHASYADISDKLNLDLSQLNAGIYIVSIYTPTNKMTYKIQKL